MNRLPLGQLCEPLRGQLLDVSIQGADCVVSGLTCDSRTVVPGDLFVAGEGSRDSGLAHLEEALRRGAVGLVADRRPELPEGVAFVGVPDVPLAKALLADRFFGHPSGRLSVIGITGTNGKTTTAIMLRSMLTMDGRTSGLVGTLGAWVGSEHVPLGNTTPDAIQLQALLARMVDQNLSAAVIEVSSHGLVQHRTHGIDVDVAVFTNLSRDHLDYHGSMEAYAEAKAILFEGLSPRGTAVLNADDPASESYGRRTRGRVVRYGLQPGADVTGRIQRLDAEGTAFTLHMPASHLSLPLTSRLVGAHNVANALAAAAAALALGVPPAAVRTGLSSLPAIPGRLQSVECGQDFRVLVDYAHTPDALEKVLALLRPLTRGRLLVVFGCGGDRDRSKRPLMGAAAARLADAVYVTSDNPRSEDPESIVDAIIAGMDGADRGKVQRLVDRREAILAACTAARGGDIVVVAGKGHETTQVLADRTVEFDDIAVTREVLWNL